MAKCFPFFWQSAPNRIILILVLACWPWARLPLLLEGSWAYSYLPLIPLAPAKTCHWACWCSCQLSSSRPVILTSHSLKKRRGSFWYVERVRVFKNHKRTPDRNTAVPAVVQLLWHAQPVSVGCHLCGFGLGSDRGEPVVTWPPLLAGARFAEQPCAEELPADSWAPLRWLAAFLSGRRLKVTAYTRASSLRGCPSILGVDELR